MNDNIFNEYMQTSVWRGLVAQATSLHGAKCCKCHATDQLTARHRTYERLGQELVTDLEVICELCYDVWPQPAPDVSACDPNGWLAYAVISCQDWNGFDAEVFEAWAEHRTYAEAMKAYKKCTDRRRKRRYADPESPNRRLNVWK